jgi:Peptidase A4 family
VDTRRTIPAGLRRAALLAGTGALLAALPSQAAAATTVSSNWAGYVARAGTIRFNSVAGSWIEPTATCTAGHASYSAVWVGLGGYSEKAKALEQIGTDADCSRGGGAHYSTWVELLPAAPVSLHVKTRPGDSMTASVRVTGHVATLRLANLTTGESSTTTRRLSSVDVSSAEWIVEAPSECVTSGSCRTLSLADFGQVGFTSATAGLAGHRGPIEDSHWRSTELLLRQSQRTAGVSSADGPGGVALVSATPSASAADDGSFSVVWGEQAAGGESPAGPTLPGFSGGPP